MANEARKVPAPTYAEAADSHRREQAARQAQTGDGLFDTPAPADPVVLPHNHTETGKEAARRAVTKASTDRMTILRAIIVLGGATREEVETYTKLDGNCIRPRVWECMDRERFDPPLLEDSGKTRETKTGSPAAVLVATDAAYAYLRKVAA